MALPGSDALLTGADLAYVRPDALLNRKAVRGICGLAKDATEAREVLEALGLMPFAEDARRPEVTS